MAFDENLAQRVRSALSARTGVTERKMFGGLAFMVRGHMSVGVREQQLMLRLGEAAAEVALKRRHVRPMDFTGRVMKGMVYVDAPGLRGAAALRKWVDAAVGFVETLPPKAPPAGKARSGAVERVRAKAGEDDVGPFEGFSASTFDFLRGLDDNNHREHFNAHRDDYEAHYVRPAAAFVAAMGPRLVRLSKSLQFEPRINGSIFRMQRDMRFSKGKPYRPSLDLFFWEGSRRGWDSSSFFLRLAPAQLTLGVGMHRFDKATAARFRQAVLDARRGPALARLLCKLGDAGPYAVHGATRKRVPRGFDGEHPRAGLLLHDGLTGVLEQPVPRQAAAASFVDYCVEHYRALAPLHRFLLRLA